MEERGLTHILYMTGSEHTIGESEYMYNINNTIQVMAVEIPKSQQNTPEINDAKDKELNNWYKFGAIEEVEDTNQTKITGRWVITKKGRSRWNEGKVQSKMGNERISRAGTTKK